MLSRVRRGFVSITTVVVVGVMSCFSGTVYSQETAKPANVKQKSVSVSSNQGPRRKSPKNKPKPDELVPNTTIGRVEETFASEKSESSDHPLSNSDQKPLRSEVSLTVGSFAVKGVEGGIMGAVEVYKISKADSSYGIDVNAELGAYRSRWSHKGVEFNLFAASVGLRADLVSDSVVTPFAGAGLVQKRSWYKGAEEAVTASFVSVKGGFFLEMSKDVSLRVEFEPRLSSLRVGSTIEI